MPHRGLLAVNYSVMGDSAFGALFAGPGEMRARCRAIDWAATPLGPIATWPPALCAAIRLCLDSGFPMCVHAGPEQVLLYNDAYVGMGVLGTDKHPGALGRPAREVWAEVWDEIAPTYAALLAGGPADFRENAVFVIQRDGKLQETVWTYARSPIRDADGKVVGIHAVGMETTARVRAESALRESEATLRASEKRHAFLVRLGDALRPLTDTALIQGAASRLLGEYLDVDRAMYAEIDGSVGDEQATIRHQYLRDVAPFPEHVAVRAFGERLSGRLRRGETIVVADVLADGEYDAQERASWRAVQCRASIVVGLVKDDLFVAALTIHSVVPRTWTDTDIALVQETAERTWEAAERARAEAARDRVLANERDARKRAEALQALAAELARAATLDEVANAVVTHATAATETRFGMLLLLDAEGTTFTIAAAPFAPTAIMESWQQFPNAGDIPAAVAARTRRPCYSRTRAEYAARGPGLDAIADIFGVQAEAALPLVVEERVIGVLSFEFAEPRDFDAEEDAHLRALADLCGPALERARLLEAERARVAAESARAEAEAANRAKDDLLAVVSHELRAPLAPMRAIAQALRRAEVPASEVRDMAVEIDRLIVYEARLIDDLLDFQRTSRGLLTLKQVRCDLHEIAYSALRVVRPLYRAKRLTLTEDLAAADQVVWAEPMRLQQIIYNLLANAVKFSPVNTSIVIRTRNPTPESIELEVVDHGEGIGPELMARLFQPFTQALTHRRSNSGLGLGLALSRRLAELHGGTLSTTSEGRGRGATFTLRLPTALVVQPVPAENTRPIETHTSRRSVRDAPHASVERDGVKQAESVGDTPRERPLRILVIDDDRSAARALQRRLLLEGHVVHVAHSLGTAEQVARAEPLDVVLADLQLGTESGLAAPRRLAEAARGEGRSVPASIVLSGYDRDSDVAQSRAAGFVEHLAKPVDDKALLLAIHRAADARSRGVERGELDPPDSGPSLRSSVQPG